MFSIGWVKWLALCHTTFQKMGVSSREKDLWNLGRRLRIGQNNCCGNMRIWVQISALRWKAGDWMLTVCSMQDRDGRMLWITGQQPCFLFNERPWSKRLVWRMPEQDTHALLLPPWAYAQPYTPVNMCENHFHTRIHTPKKKKIGLTK